eukprot:scaffold175_cov177-Amphora_coffeaeformis.AAC.14
MGEAGDIPLSLLLGTGATTVLLASALAYVLMETRKNSKQNDSGDVIETAVVTAMNIDREQYPGGLVTIYYATQTGTAESFARQLEREAPDHGFYAHVVDLEDIALENLVEPDATEPSKAIFLAATYGEGEAPDNATLFCEALSNKADTKVLEAEHDTAVVEEAILNQLEFCVFGLGNRQYDHFNAMGKFFDRVMVRLGAQRILPLGVGDDDNDLEGDFETWKDNQLWPTFEKKFLGGVAVPTKKSTTEVPDCQFAIEYHPTGTKAKLIPADQVHSSSRPYFDAVDCPVSTVQELRSDKDSTVHVEVDISKAKGLSYQTADNLGVLPLNNPKIVKSVADALGYDLDQVFSLKAAGTHEWHGAPFPMPLTVRDFLTRYCDLTGAPRRSELKLLTAFAKDPLDQKALLRLSSKEGKAEYKEKVTDALTGLAQILQRCPSIAMPLEHFVDLCPRMQPRFFTISSSSSVYPQSVHLTVAVTRQQRADGTLFEGVCSTHLAKQQPKTDQIRVFVRPSTFRLPKDTSKPILMIGPGTGVAPMRALLQERAHQRAKGANILYFGCREAKLDFLYQGEFEEWKAKGTLTELHTAFSRAQAKKVYVQHLLQQNAESTWKLLEEQGAYVYVCGAVQMGHDVGETLQQIVALHGGRNPTQAKAYLSKLAQEGRYVQELWA